MHSRTRLVQSTNMIIKIREVALVKIREFLLLSNLKQIIWAILNQSNQVAEAVSILWDDDGIKQCYDRRREYQVRIWATTLR